MNTQQHTEFISLENKRHECCSCNDKSWWCRGCGFYRKTKGLCEKLGMKHQEATVLLEDSFSKCGSPLVPCYVCNKDGKKPAPVDHDHIVSHWWE